ncbi:MAG: twin-arginine translocation signal domain-containing protein [Acidobacteria bacterium]|nr:twin-arginine translocation signal domain-containing protein [Acidobacteriota bacterium]
MSLSRRHFIKGVIAAGAAASSGAYLFRGTGPIFGQC